MAVRSGQHPFHASTHASIDFARRFALRPARRTSSSTTSTFSSVSSKVRPSSAAPLLARTRRLRDALSRHVDFGDDLLHLWCEARAMKRPHVDVSDVNVRAIVARSTKSCTNGNGSKRLWAPQRGETRVRNGCGVHIRPVRDTEPSTADPPFDRFG